MTECLAGCLVSEIHHRPVWQNWGLKLECREVCIVATVPRPSSPLNLSCNSPKPTLLRSLMLHRNKPYGKSQTYLSRPRNPPPQLPYNRCIYKVRGPCSLSAAEGPKQPLCHGVRQDLALSLAVYFLRHFPAPSGRRSTGERTKAARPRRDEVGLNSQSQLGHGHASVLGSAAALLSLVMFS